MSEQDAQLAEHKTAAHAMLSTIAAGGEKAVKAHHEACRPFLNTIAAGGEKAVEAHKRSQQGVLSVIAAGGEKAVKAHRDSLNGTLSIIAAGGEKNVEEHKAASQAVLSVIAAGGEEAVRAHEESQRAVHAAILAGGDKAIEAHKMASHGLLSVIAGGGEKALEAHKAACSAVLQDVAAGGSQPRSAHAEAIKAVHDALPKRPKRSDGLVYVGAGAEGIKEMQKFVEDDKMYFGLLVFTVGSGTFMRHKLLSVHFQGEKMSPMVRGRILAKRNVATDLLGSTHGNIQFVHKADVTLPYVVEHMGKFFASDHGKHDIDVQKITDDYEKMIEATKVAKLTKTKSFARKTARDFRKKPSGAQVLKWVHAKNAKEGPFNWALFEPSEKKLDFYNAGSLSVDEMLKDLDPTKVLAGVVRMSFGKGRFKRTKWIAIWWSGEKVSAMKRGKLNAMKGAMTKMMAPYTLMHTAQCPDDITLETLIQKVHDYCTIDGKGEHGEDLYTVEAFMEGLQDELGDNANYFGDKGDVDEPLETLEEAVEKVRKFEGYNWVLMKMKDPKKRRRTRKKTK